MPYLYLVNLTGMEAVPHIKTFRLSELTGSIGRTITRFFDNKMFWVIADITDHRYYPSKQHHYCCLVEKEEGTNQVLASLPGRVWRPGGRKIREWETLTGQQFRSGIHVLLLVAVDFHAAYGLTLSIMDVDPSFTLGKLEQQRQGTLQRLLRECGSVVQKDGDRYRTRNNSLPCKPVLQRIAVVSSRQSDGYEDFRHTLEENPYRYAFRTDTYFTAVQGEGNAEGLCRRLKEICACGIPYDAVVIIRGGGAQTDLLLFDHFELCRQIAAYPIPVITGIGHQKNESIADLMAHSPTKTPTKAAEQIINHNRRYELALFDLQNRAVIRAQQVIGKQQHWLGALNTKAANQARAVLHRRVHEYRRLNGLITRSTRQQLHQRQAEVQKLSVQLPGKPLLTLARKEQHLEQVKGSVKLSAGKLLGTRMSRLNSYEAMCRMMSPVNILKKGFALVYAADKITTAANNITAGTKINVRMADGTIDATANKVTKTSEDEFNL